MHSCRNLNGSEMFCKICGVANPGNHNGNSCCRACAAFFRRTVQLKLKYKCKQNGECKIQSEKRYFCRFCRMKKCIAAGMKSAENPVSPPDFSLDDISIFSEEMFHPENVISNHEEFMIELKAKIEEILSEEPVSSKFPFPLAVCQQAAVAYSEHEEKWPNCSTLNYSLEFPSEEVYCEMHKEFLFIAQFCMRIGPFAELPLDQKQSLIKGYYGRFVLFDRLFASMNLLGNDVEDTRIVYHGGYVGDVFRSENNSFLHGMEEIVVDLMLKPFKRLNPDHFEFMYILIYALFNLGKSHRDVSKETEEMTVTVKERVAQELLYYYQYSTKKVENPANRIYKIHNLISAIDRIEEHRSHKCRMARTFDLLKIDLHFHDITH